MVPNRAFSTQARDELILKFSTLVAQAMVNKEIPPLPGFQYGQSPYFASLSNVLPQVRALHGTKSKFETEAEQDAAVVSFFLNMSWLTRLILNNELYLLPDLGDKERRLAIQQELLDAANRELQALLSGQLGSDKILREKLAAELHALMELLSLLNRGSVNNAGLGLWLQLQDQYAYLDMLHIAKNAEHYQNYLQSMDELLATTLANERLEAGERTRLEDARTAIAELSGRYQQLQTQHDACINDAGTINHEAYQAYRQHAQALTQRVQVLRGQMNAMAHEMKPRHAAFANKVQAIDQQLASRLTATNREFKALKQALAKQIAQVAPAKGDMAKLLHDIGLLLDTASELGSPELSAIGSLLIEQSQKIQKSKDPLAVRLAMETCANEINRCLEQSSVKALTKQPLFNELLNQLREMQTVLASNNQPAPFSPTLAQTMKTVMQRTTSVNTPPPLSSSAKAHSKLSQITRAAPAPLSHSAGSTGLPEHVKPEPTNAATTKPISEVTTMAATEAKTGKATPQASEQAPHATTAQEKLKKQLAEIKVKPEEAKDVLHISEECLTEIENLYEKLQELKDDPDLCDLPGDYVDQLLKQAEHIYQQAQQSGQADPEALQQLRNRINEGKAMYPDSEDLNDIENALEKVEIELEEPIQSRPLM